MSTSLSCTAVLPFCHCQSFLSFLCAKAGNGEGDEMSGSEEGASPEQTDKEERSMCFDGLRRGKRQGLNVRGNTEKGAGKGKRVIQADSVCVSVQQCVVVTSGWMDRGKLQRLHVGLFCCVGLQPGGQHKNTNPKSCNTLHW